MKVVSVTPEQAKSLLEDFQALIDDDQVAVSLTLVSLDGDEIDVTFVNSTHVELVKTVQQLQEEAKLGWTDASDN